MMKSTILHTNFNVLDLQKSLAFYEKAVGLTEKRRNIAADGSFIIVFLGDGESSCELELTWLADRKEPYDLGDEEFHLAVKMADPKEARRVHEEMGCICFENKEMGLYFIKDPDGYWIEIL